MKNIKFILFAAVLAIAAACTKDNVVAPETEEVKTVTMTLNVTTENDADTKVYLKDGVMTWNSKDYIYVFSDEDIDNATNRYVFTNAGEGVFKCESWPSDRTPKYALFTRMSKSAEAAASYSANISTRYDNNGDASKDQIIAVAQANQSLGNANSFGGNANISVGAVKGDAETGYSVKLENVTGLLKFKTSEAPAKITFSGNNNEIVSGGRIRLRWDEKTENGNPVPSWNQISSEGAKEIVATPTFSWSKDNTYYVCVLPQTFSSGISVTVETMEGKSYTQTSANPMTLERNKVIDLGTLSAPSNQLVLDVMAAIPTAVSSTDDTITFPNADKTAWDAAEYNLTIGGIQYPFEFWAGINTSAATAGYYYDAENGFFQIGYTYGYIKFPAIEGKRLLSVSVEGKNSASSQKDFAVVEDPYKTAVSNYAAFVSLDGSARVALGVGVSKVWTFNEGKGGTSANTSYYLQCRGGSGRLGKLVLTYVDAE